MIIALVSQDRWLEKQSIHCSRYDIILLNHRLDKEILCNNLQTLFSNIRTICTSHPTQNQYTSRTQPTTTPSAARTRPLISRSPRNLCQLHHPSTRTYTHRKPSKSSISAATTIASTTTIPPPATFPPVIPRACICERASCAYRQSLSRFP